MSVKNIQANEVGEMLKNDSGSIEIIDVRQPDEYEAIHIKGSKLIPMDEMADSLKEIDWDKKVIFVCRSGSRSGMMANLVSAQSGEEIHNLNGGIAACYAGGMDRKFFEIREDKINDYL